MKRNYCSCIYVWCFAYSLHLQHMVTGSETLCANLERAMHVPITIEAPLIMNWCLQDMFLVLKMLAGSVACSHFTICGGLHVCRMICCVRCVADASVRHVCWVQLCAGYTWGCCCHHYHSACSNFGCALLRCVGPLSYFQSHFPNIISKNRPMFAEAGLRCGNCTNDNTVWAPCLIFSHIFQK
jgi:hypothetical protein